MQDSVSVVEGVGVVRHLGCLALAVARAELPAGTRFHDLRHSYAALLIAEGAPADLAATSPDPRVREFLKQGEDSPEGTSPAARAP